MHADVVTVDVRWDFFPFAGIERKADALLQFRQERAGSPAMFKEEKFETSLFPALTQNFAGAENFRHAADYLDDLAGLDESVECHREVRIGGKTASDAQCKTYLGFSVTAPSGGGEADVVDFGIGAPVAATGNGDFEFAGQIVKIGIATEFAVDLQRERGGVDNLLPIEAGEQASGDVAGDVYAGARSGEANVPKALQNNWQRFYRDPVQLNVLTYGDVCDAAAVFFCKIRYGAHLLAAHQTVGNADAHHEKWHGLAFAIFATDYADSIALGVNAPGTKISAQPFGRNGIESGASELLDLIEMVPGIFGTLEALDALCFGFRRLSFGRFIWNNLRHGRLTCECFL